MQNQNRFYEFANFRIDVAKHRLLKDGEPLPVTPKAVEILLLLAQNSGRIVEKDELMAAIWPDTVVEESNLTQTVYVLRKILGQDASGEKFIQTIPKRGYRFLHELLHGLVRRRKTDGVWTSTLAGSVGYDPAAAEIPF